MVGWSSEKKLNTIGRKKHLNFRILECSNLRKNESSPFLRKSNSHFRCKRKAFKTTETELRAMAPPAIQGARNPAAAIGIPSAL